MQSGMALIALQLNFYIEILSKLFEDSILL